MQSTGSSCRRSRASERRATEVTASGPLHVPRRPSPTISAYASSSSTRRIEVSTGLAAAAAGGMRHRDPSGAARAVRLNSRDLRVSLSERIVPRRIRQRLLGANLLLATGIIAIFVVLLVAVVSLRNSSARAEHSARVIAAGAGLEKSVLDLETGLRGYALTGQRRFLEPYVAARGRIGAESDDLVRLVADNAGRGRLARALRARIREYVSVYGTRLVAASGHGLGPAAHVARTGAGKGRVDAMRVRFDALERNERGLANR